jgi:hypothetical protein
MRWFVLALMIGCAPGSGDPTEPTAPTEPTSPPVDTGFPPGDLANLHVRHDVNQGTTVVYGLFVESAPNFVNLARCVIEEGGCLPLLPQDEDTPLLVDPDDELDTDTLRTRYVGDVLGLGPYTLDYRENPDTQVGFYAADQTEVGPLDGYIGASWAGQWPEYVGTEDLYVSAPIDLITPPEGGKLTFTNGQGAILEWVPTGDGELTLSLSKGFGDAVVYHVDDDGYFELDTDALTGLLGITDEVTELTGVLTRWNRSTVLRFGHVVEYVASSEVSFGATLVQIGTRERVLAADECPQAQGALALEPGEYWGFLGAPRLDGQYDAPNTCLDPDNSSVYDDALGPDGLFRLVIAPRHQVTVDYTLFTESGSVYLVDNCNNVAGTCVDGSDLSEDPNEHEFVSFFNQDDDDRTLYLVVDATESNAESYFTLDVNDQLLDEPAMYDTCAQAEDAPATVTTGTWWGTFVAYTGGTNPGVGGCTGTSLGGADAMTPIVLGPGQTLTASVDMADGDPGLYLLYDCADTFSCPIGADQNLGPREGLSYTHSGAYPLTVYLVVDSKSGIKPYFLTIDIR